MLNLIALHGQSLRLPKGWDASASCWLNTKPALHPPTHWFNTESEALAFAHTLKWWIMSERFPSLWRVEEMDGYR